MLDLMVNHRVQSLGLQSVWPPGATRGHQQMLAKVTTTHCEGSLQFISAVLHRWRERCWWGRLLAALDAALQCSSERLLIHLRNAYSRELRSLKWQTYLCCSELLGTKLDLSPVDHLQKLMRRDILRKHDLLFFQKFTERCIYRVQHHTFHSSSLLDGLDRLDGIDIL